MIEPESSGWIIYRLPRSHWHCTFDFDWDAVRPATLQERLGKFLSAVEAGEAPHLLLTGPPGIGKSHLGVATYRWAARRFGTLAATWVNVPAFCDQVKRSYDSGVDPFDEYERAHRLVVLDDLFGRDLTQHEASQIVYRLIDTAYRNGAAVFVTMNHDVKELTVRFDPHEQSRVLAGATVIPMSADHDYRLRRGGTR